MGLKLIYMAAKTVRYVVLPLLVGVGVFGGGLVVGLLWFDQTGPGVALKATADKYDVMKDTLVIVLSLAGILIAVFGIGTYFLLRTTLNQYLSEEISDRFYRAIVRGHINQAYFLWQQFQHTREEFLLEHAINVNRQAYDQAQSLKEERPDNELILCSIRNNLGYYLATKREPTSDDMLEARSLADYLETKVNSYPEEGIDWRDTIAYIRRRFQAQNGVV